MKTTTQSCNRSLDVQARRKWRRKRMRLLLDVSFVICTDIDISFQNEHVYYFSHVIRSPKNALIFWSQESTDNLVKQNMKK